MTTSPTAPIPAPTAETLLRPAMSFARMLLLAQRRFKARQQQPAAPA